MATETNQHIPSYKASQLCIRDRYDFASHSQLSHAVGTVALYCIVYSLWCDTSSILISQTLWLSSAELRQVCRLHTGQCIQVLSHFHCCTSLSWISYKVLSGTFRNILKTKQLAITSSLGGSCDVVTTWNLFWWVGRFQQPIIPDNWGNLISCHYKTLINNNKQCHFKTKWLIVPNCYICTRTCFRVIFCHSNFNNMIPYTSGFQNFCSLHCTYICYHQ